MLQLLREFQEPTTAKNIVQRLRQWYKLCDPSAPLHKTIQLNTMHVLGAQICCDLDGIEFSGYDSFDVVAAFAAVAPMPFDEPLLKNLDWQELTGMMTTLQLEYKRLLVWNDTVGWATFFDYCQFMPFVLRRMGYWIGRSWRLAAPSQEPDLDATQGIVVVDSAGWRTLAPSSIAHLLSVVHTFAALTDCLLSAEVVSVADASTLVDLHAHHREASIDEYYVNAMVADLPVGSILQYAHRFQYLFHSVTQVIYFHWPSYKRLGQIPLAELQQPDTAPANLLPLLMQIDPEIPVLNEHTKALCHTCATTAAAPWAWINVSGFFALVHHDGSVYVARDLRELFAYYLRHKNADKRTRCMIPVE